MKKITEKYYIGANPKNLDKNKMYVIAHIEGKYVASYTYNFEREGWLQNMPFYQNPERVKGSLDGSIQSTESNHDVAQRINATVNPRFQSFLYDEAYEMEPKELEKFILIKKLVR